MFRNLYEQTAGAVTGKRSLVIIPVARGLSPHQGADDDVTDVKSSAGRGSHNSERLVRYAKSNP